MPRVRFYEPVSAPCGHKFCRPCYYPGIMANNPRHARTCPCCRQEVPPEAYDPPVLGEMWAMLQREYAPRVSQRRAHFQTLARQQQAAAQARRRQQKQSGLEPPPPEVEADIRNDIRAHRDQLRHAMQALAPALAAHGVEVAAYFQKLELELCRPSGELYRCDCVPRYVMLRKAAGREGQQGRLYHGCPLWMPGKGGGCGKHVWVN